MQEHPAIRVVQRKTPDAADQRHQLYVQWLNARASEPDILQLDVIWTPEFAAAGWILPLDEFQPETEDFFPATLRANRQRARAWLTRTPRASNVMNDASCSANSSGVGRVAQMHCGGAAPFGFN